MSLQLGNWRRSRELDNAALRLRLGTPLILHRYHPPVTRSWCTAHRLPPSSERRSGGRATAYEAVRRVLVPFAVDIFGALGSSDLDSFKQIITHYARRMRLSHRREERRGSHDREQLNRDEERKYLCLTLIQQQLLKLPIALTSTETDSTVLTCSSPTTPLHLFYSTNIKKRESDYTTAIQSCFNKKVARFGKGTKLSIVYFCRR